jgi:hypothetical protein
MLARHSGDQTLVPALEQTWEHMVSRRMYVTGGIGSLPALEGFGNDYELDPEYAYAETCAALASMFWNWEMAQLTGEAKYSDLFEWQLYNAAAVGMGLDGKKYFYNNPLTCRGGVTRKPWYAVPCCPSNLSRTWADIGKYIYSQDKDEIWIHQYISSQYESDVAKIEVRSDFPWNGNVQIKIDLPTEVTLHLRMPSWSKNPQVDVNGEDVMGTLAPGASVGDAISHDNGQAGYHPAPPTASGYNPGQSRFLPLKRTWHPGSEIALTFDMPIMLRKAYPNVKGHQGKVAVTRGPLVYCLESTDNSDINIFDANLDASLLTERFEPDLLGGIVKLTAKTTDNKLLTFIPYHLWGNRGESTMTVWVNA